jgi:hypothetical protein
MKMLIIRDADLHGSIFDPINRYLGKKRPTWDMFSLVTGLTRTCYFSGCFGRVDRVSGAPERPPDGSTALRNRTGQEVRFHCR